MKEIDLIIGIQDLYFILVYSHLHLCELQFDPLYYDQHTCCWVNR